jgi:hypothetical protein
MKKTIYFLLFGLCLAVAQFESRAQVLDIGETVSPVPDQTSIGVPLLVGPTVSLFNIDSLEGSVTSGVFANEPSNPFGSDKLTFLYAINSVGTDIIWGLTIPGFAGFLTHVNDLVNGGVEPASATRSEAPGDTVTFTFSPLAIQPGEISRTLLVHTDMDSGLSFGTTAGFVSGIDNTAFVPGLFVPVPEPGEYALIFGFGLLGMAAWRRYRALPAVQ